MERHYFDWAATSPPDILLMEECLNTAITSWGNPSSRHREGRDAKSLLEEARRRCAAVLKVPPESLYFCSGGTEANNLVLESLMLRAAKVSFIHSSVEHPSIIAAAKILHRTGHACTVAPVEADGRVSRDSIEAAMRKANEARLIAIMSVNNETGSIMDIAGLAAHARRLHGDKGPRLHIHSDMVQAVGKIRVDLSASDIDSASISAHKIGGPRGIGLLYLRKPFELLSAGGGQERGVRSGTENLFGALAMARCLEAHAAEEPLSRSMQAAGRRMDTLVSAFKAMDRCELIPADRVPGDPRFSPWILQASFRGLPAEVFVRMLDDRGFALSTGSACSAADRRRPVLEAMGVDPNRAFESIRCSQGWTTTDADIDALIAAIADILTKS